MKTTTIFGNLFWRALICCTIMLIARSGYFVALDIDLTRRSATWPSVSGVVVRYADVHGKFNPRSWRDDKIVEYRYQVAGIAFTGNRISFARRLKWYFQDVKALTDDWRSNSNVTVYFDPKNPDESVLQPGGSMIPSTVFFSAQLISICLLSGLLVWHTRQCNLIRARASQ